MEIKITAKAYRGVDSWEHKRKGVVLVEKESDIGRVFAKLPLQILQIKHKC